MAGQQCAECYQKSRLTLDCVVGMMGEVIFATFGLQSSPNPLASFVD